MNVDFQGPAGTRGISSLRSSERGFSALELLVIVVIICVMVAIGVPVLHSQAKAAILDTNLQTLSTKVKELVVEGYSARYRASGDGDPKDYLSLQLEESLSAAGQAGYMNPAAGSKEGRVILNSGARPTDSSAVPPAVFITDAPECQYDSFEALSDASRHLLAGTLLVTFDAGTRTVDVFFVDGAGKKSPAVVSVPTG
jgi:type II secretory pathway pseudopilin PulG